ncbi:hypothetical protein Back11_07050 [Paenibacillus baekrokdamisoli]|uniref:Uncharacterized protein n=1 Tax=Paenibacillus baekrokdamisoli TaxID=1712516 RepID=A0A3G9IKD2_9BACL|nr:hypothetical protein [Paenibacillus baekrokdamisoli]MBB3067453.1 hypothetical protein [Paenibacillus baekrokdamisoli]BBH19360.1 hypothetical protein Back11_07050 [Paenibacillus baekrokdamisoli]
MAGLVAGSILAAVLKYLQVKTNKRVYTLLLNIDFIPYTPKNLPETMELALHLAVSVPLGMIYLLIVQRWGHRFLFGLFLGLVSACTWIPLTLVSDRVPSISDFVALFLWLSGHAIFGLILSLFAGRNK